MSLRRGMASIAAAAPSASSISFTPTFGSSSATKDMHNHSPLGLRLQSSREQVRRSCSVTCRCDPLRHVGVFGQRPHIVEADAGRPGEAVRDRPAGHEEAGRDAVARALVVGEAGAAE